MAAKIWQWSKNTKEESILSSFDAVDGYFEFDGLPKEQITRY